MIYTIQPMVELRTDRSGDLLLKARSGDEEALNQLLARYRPHLRPGPVDGCPGVCARCRTLETWSRSGGNGT